MIASGWRVRAEGSIVATFDEAVDYGQIVVGNARAKSPGPQWTDAEVAQGFAWTPGMVAFGVPDRDGTCRIVVALAPRVSVDPAALWAVRVPFEVLPGSVEIGTVTDPRAVPVPPGRYSLVFEAVPGAPDHAFVLHATFCDDPHPDWQILKRGDELKTDTVLRHRSERV